MKIEEGKSYLDENNMPWMALSRDTGYENYPWRIKNCYGHIRFCADDGKAPDGPWLVAEAPSEPAPTGPVVVETRKRIVEGVYDRLDIRHVGKDSVMIRIAGGVGNLVNCASLNAQELRTLMTHLGAVADALDEGAR